MIAALEALLRLRQAACHPDLLPGVTGEASAKLALLTETLINSSQNQHKTLVFSQWTRFLDLIEPALECAGIPFLRLDGSTVDRQAIVTAFQTENGPPVLLMSLKAGGVGLNLTAADHVIITDPWWNPAAEDQAADRAHRIGQERPVLIQRLVALDTVEERILKLQERKRSLALAALHGTEAKTTSITPQDLLALID
jgi:SNF2 family DNA or RNA helicase